ncbi:MAG TPA: MFS transporter [Desulfatiglandales bacterium]|nr:MFS transporter [Desulfatiglandales bacterium]
MSKKNSNGKSSPLNVPYVWAFTTYFAEGLPYTIIRMVSSVFFRDMRVSLEAIGLTSLFGIPWVIKFLWGPLIDQFGTKRKWILIMQFLLVLLFLVVAVMSALPFGVTVIGGLLFFGAFLSATHDIAIDGYYMEALDKEGQAKFVGYRVMAYRLAMMAGTGIIVTVGTTVGWLTAFVSGAGVLGVLFIYHNFFLPRVEAETSRIRDLVRRVFRARFLVACAVVALVLWGMRSLVWQRLGKSLLEVLPFLKGISFSGWVAIGLLISLIGLAFFRNKIKELLLKDKESFYSQAFIDYMDREHMAVAIAFIILMRTGESTLAAMAAPFMVDLGVKVHYGWLSGGVGLPFSIIGAMAGGFLISTFSLRRTIWPLLLAQNLTNLVYMVLALSMAKYLALNTGAEVITSVGHFNLFLVACVHAFDQFAGGLGTAVLITFLMRTCSERFKAAHFAIGTGLMNVSGVLAGVASGFLAQRLGYGLYFGLTFLFSIPGMCLIFFVPFLDTENR